MATQRNIFREFAVREEVWEGTKQVDIIFTPIYELIYNDYELNFQTYNLRKEAYALLKKGESAPNSTFKYVQGIKVYTKIIK